MAGEHSGVSTVFELMLEELDAEIDLVSRDGARAFEARDLAKARALADEVEWLTEFRNRMADLRATWSERQQLGKPARRQKAERTRRRRARPLPPGARTQKREYFPYILKALEELGGEAPTKDVVDRVGQLMDGQLKGVDYQPVDSSPNTPRWRNGAMFARVDLVKQGLMRTDSPNGTWAISDEGRAWMAEQGQSRGQAGDSDEG